MGHDILDQPGLGARALSINYRRAGEGVGMNPTSSHIMDDRDRLDWLERSIVQIRGVLDDSGYGKLLGRMVETAAAVTAIQAAVADLAQQAGAQMTELTRLVAVDAQRHAWLEERVAVLEAQIHEQTRSTEEAFSQVLAELSDIRKTLSKPPWWKFWS